MTTAYVVTEGSYSEYRIVAVFLDRLLADELCDRHKGWYGEPEVEEYEIITALPAAIVTLSLQCTVTDGTEGELFERENVSTVGLFDGYAVESQCKTQMYVISLVDGDALSGKDQDSRRGNRPRTGPQGVQQNESASDRKL